MLASVRGEFLSKELCNFPSAVTGDFTFPVRPSSLRRHLRKAASPASGAPVVGPVGGGRERKVRGRRGHALSGPTQTLSLPWRGRLGNLAKEIMKREISTRFTGAIFPP